MIIQEKVITIPKTLTTAEQVEKELEDHPHEGAVLLVPDGDNGLKYFYRGTGGAWWEARYNEESVSVNLHHFLRDVKDVILITRVLVDDFISGDAEIRLGVGDRT